MTGDNRIVIAAAGSGKTTHLVREALKVGDGRVLITTFTESNESEIRAKFFELVGHVPANVVVMTWFSFLIAHGVKPFQGGMFDFHVAGMIFATSQSSVKRYHNGRPIIWPESDVANHYFDRGGRVYSDRLPKLVVRCNERSGGAVIDRIARVFRHVFVDEVQDLAGYDLDILALLARCPVRLLMVGDPRQVTYLTHRERKYHKYADAGIVEFLRVELRRVQIDVDDETLNRSHRNSELICAVSSRLYPKLVATAACGCAGCRASEPPGSGAFVLRREDYDHYLSAVRPMQLREKIDSSGVDLRWPAMNFGQSKGRGFDHVVILPTKPMQDWLRNPNAELAPQSRAKFYVAITRARHSFAIAMDWGSQPLPDGFSLYNRGSH